MLTPDTPSRSSPHRTRHRSSETSGLHRLWQCTMFYGLLLHLGATSLTWNLISLVIYPFLTQAQGVTLGRAAISSIYRGFWTLAAWLGLMRLDAGSLDVLRRDAGLIVAANHPTMLDALLVVARLPRGVCIMRAGLMRNPFLGAGARLARYLRNDTPCKMISSAVSVLRQGGQIVWFPEGTRSVRTPINPFRRGVTLVAQRAGVPIQTVLIESTPAYLGKGWPIWRAPAFPVVIRIRLGHRFAPEADYLGLLRLIEAYFEHELGRVGVANDGPNDGQNGGPNG